MLLDHYDGGGEGAACFVKHPLSDQFMLFSPLNSRPDIKICLLRFHDRKCLLMVITSVTLEK